MITERTYFKSDLNQISQLIFEHDKDVLTYPNYKIHDFSVENITERFNDIFMIFPYHVQDASDDIGISNYTIAIFECYSSINAINEISVNDRKEIERMLEKNEYDNSNIEDSCCDIISDFFHLLVYSYPKIISNTKKLPFFFDVNEVNILKNLLKLYKGLLKDNSKQLFIFGTLPKKIADKITEMLIDFIEQRIAVLNPEFDYGDIQFKAQVKTDVSKITWLGTQQELIELFNELIDKKWIPEIEYRGMRRFVDTILNTFDLTNTQRNPKSDLSKSFYQQFKGDPEGNKRVYSFLDSKSYERKFDHIKSNKQKKETPTKADASLK